jgi:uncharacterized protein (DUF4415 family)
MPKTSTKPAATDWERVKREAAQDSPIAHSAADGPYDPNDAAAALKRPTLNMRVDADVLEAFKATGRGWQTRVNSALREAVAHGLNKV